MTNCKTFKDLFIEYLFGEIEEEKKRRLENHLDQCPKCEAELAEMTQTLQMMGKKSRIEPPEEYWNTYWSKLSARMDKERAPQRKAKVKWWHNIRKSFIPILRPTYKWAAVMAALVLGVLIGRFLITSDGIKEAPMTQQRPFQEEGTYAQTVDYRAEKYLEKSKIFLLGFVNTNGEIQERDYDLGRQREVSQNLIHEASYLKENLKGHSQQRLISLIEELETILIEIANMEEEEDIPDIELIRDGIDRKGILLKINVHQMGDRLDREKPEPETKKDKALI